MPILLELLQKLEAERIPHNSFYKVSITLSKPKTSPKKGNHRPIFLMNTYAKITKQNTSKPNPAAY